MITEMVLDPGRLRAGMAAVACQSAARGGSGMPDPRGFRHYAAHLTPCRRAQPLTQPSAEVPRRCLYCTWRPPGDDESLHAATGDRHGTGSANAGSEYAYIPRFRR